jgi:hypothetical protein
LNDFCAFALLIPHIKTISQHLAILLAIRKIFCKKVIFIWLVMAVIFANKRFSGFEIS